MMDWAAALATAVGGVILRALGWLWRCLRRKPADPKPGPTMVIPVPPPPPGTTHAEYRITVDYVDGLPQAIPEIRDPFEEARRLQKEHKYAEAIKLFETCFQEETTASQRTALHILIGNCFLLQSELEEAEGHYRQAETAAKNAGEPEDLAAALGNMGVIYGQKGELDEALSQFERTLKIDREIGNRLGEANQLGNMGIVYRRKGELDKALSHYEQALKIDREIGNRLGEANALGNTGNVCTMKGELDKALSYYEQALKIDREIGNRLGEAQDLGNMGNIYSQKGERDRAVELLKEALAIFQEIGAGLEIETAKENIERVAGGGE